MNKHWLLVGGVSFAMAGLGLGNLARAEDKDGKEEAEVKVSIKEVPSVVRKTLKRESHGADVKTVDKEEKHGKTVYEADAKIDGQNFEILIDEDGTLISKLPDNEEDEKPAKHETKSRRDGEDEERGEAKGRREKEDEDHGKAKGREDREDEDRDEENEGRGEERGHAGGASAKTGTRLLAQIHEVREELDKLEQQVKEMSGRGSREEKEEARPSRGKHRAEAEEEDDEKAEKRHEANHHE